MDSHAPGCFSQDEMLRTFGALCSCTVCFQAFVSWKCEEHSCWTQWRVTCAKNKTFLRSWPWLADHDQWSSSTGYCNRRNFRGECHFVVIKQIHTFTSNILFEQRRFGLGCPSLYQVKWPFDLIKAGAIQTETSLLKQNVAGERVDLLDDYDFPARTITETGSFRSFRIIEKCTKFQKK